MHELAVTEDILSSIAEKCGDAKIARVVLEIGKLSMVQPQSLRFCFELCCAGTPLEGAELEIIETPGRAKCRACAEEVLLDKPFGRCVCGNSDLEWVSGEEMRIKKVELV